MAIQAGVDRRRRPATAGAPLAPRTPAPPGRTSPLLRSADRSTASAPAGGPALVDPPRGGPITGGRVVPCCWRNSAQGGHMLVAGDTNAFGSCGVAMTCLG